MAQAYDRSPTREFRQGCIDNSYIQIAPNVGGLVEMDWRIDRANVLPYWLRAEERTVDPFDLVRRHHAARPVENIVGYKPRRDQVQVF